MYFYVKNHIRLCIHACVYIIIGSVLNGTNFCHRILPVVTRTGTMFLRKTALERLIWKLTKIPGTTLWNYPSVLLQ